jgi:hypothetical protein
MVPLRQGCTGQPCAEFRRRAACLMAPRPPIVGSARFKRQCDEYPARTPFHPRLYLRQWCNRAGKLVEYTIKHDKLIAKVVGPNATGFEFDLYAFPEMSHSGSNRGSLTMPIERPQMPSTCILLATRPGGMTNCAVRGRDSSSGCTSATPTQCQSCAPARKPYGKALANPRNENTRGIRQPGEPGTFDEYIGRLDPHIVAKAKMSIIAQGFDNEIVGERVNRMHWAVIDASSLTFLTSDRPVSLFNVGTAKGCLWLPLSPTKLFVAVNDQRHLQNLASKTPREIVRLVNLDVVARPPIRLDRRSVTGDVH